jgi:hypothetical protein
MKHFPPKRDFHSLALRDLLDARDAYHIHLAHLANVVGTAVGRYRIRVEDPDAKEPISTETLLTDDREGVVRRGREPRRLGNSVIKAWSWPCVLVFVSEWLPPEVFANNPDQWVPRFLYLADGRVVPTCVILAEKDEAADPPLGDLEFPSRLVGGGYPLLTVHQGRQRVGSIGCLVTDGDTVYALTNRHAAGEPGREVTTVIDGERCRLGVSDQKQLGKKAFPAVYPGWPGTRCEVNLDVGLVRVDDLSRWTAQVFGVGELGPLVDLNVDTLSLDLIGCDVRAFGGASGELEGQVQGLFYRYRSVGGFDYVADMLIGPRPGGVLRTRAGDSGTVWVWDPKLSLENARKEGEAGRRARRYRPLALQWGGHALLETSARERVRFALATCLSTVCRELDVDVIRDWNIGHDEYWGKVGHYKVGAAACDLIGEADLATLIGANRGAISVDDDGIRKGTLKKIKMNQKKFVPLADVADLVWRASRKKDAANHFADMDEEGTGPFAGKTLISLYDDDKDTLTPATWHAFYESLEKADKDQGALPFRVAQFYAEMVRFVAEGNLVAFVCAAGCVAHYVGDACQPLHISFLHHGTPGVEHEHNVHTVYETNMLDQRAAELVEAVNKNLAGWTVPKNRLYRGADRAARSMMELMIRTMKRLPPQTIIDTYNAVEGRGRVAHMWDELGDATADVMAEGAKALAVLWESAWREGVAQRDSAGDPPFSAGDLGVVSKLKLMGRYNDREFVQALWLREMAAAGIPGLAAPNPVVR